MKGKSVNHWTQKNHFNLLLKWYRIRFHKALSFLEPIDRRCIRVGRNVLVFICGDDKLFFVTFFTLNFTASRPRTFRTCELSSNTDEGIFQVSSRQRTTFLASDIPFFSYTIHFSTGHTALALTLRSPWVCAGYAWFCDFCVAYLGLQTNSSCVAWATIYGDVTIGDVINFGASALMKYRCVRLRHFTGMSQHFPILIVTFIYFGKYCKRKSSIWFHNLPSQKALQMARTVKADPTGQTIE